MAKPIVAGADGSAPAIAAVEWAAADARRRKLALRVVHVCEHLLFSMGKTQYCAGALEAAADKARALAPDMEVSTELLTGNVIAAMASKLGDLRKLLHSADPQDNAEVYEQLGLRMTYDPGPENSDRQSSAQAIMYQMVSVARRAVRPPRPFPRRRRRRPPRPPDPG